jgi:hypothetical protein
MVPTVSAMHCPMARTHRSASNKGESSINTDRGRPLNLVAPSARLCYGLVMAVIESHLRHTHHMLVDA